MFYSANPMEFMLFKKYLGFLRKQNTKFNMKYIALSFYYRVFLPPLTTLTQNLDKG